MDKYRLNNDLAHVATAVRDACARAAAEAYEDAGIQGLCAEGRWEVALEAIHRVDVQAIIYSITGRPGSRGRGLSDPVG